MKQLILEMHGSHELLVEDMQAHNLNNVEVIEGEIGPTRKLKERIGRYGDLASGVFFTKTLFQQMISATGEFIFLRHLDEEGWTFTPHKFSRGRNLVSLLTVVTVPSLLWTIILGSFGVISRIGWPTLFWIPILGVSTMSVLVGFPDTIKNKTLACIEKFSLFLWSHVMGPNAFLRRFRNMSQDELVSALFPKGHDEAVEPASEAGHIKVRVTLPNCPATIRERIAWLTQVGQQIGAKPLLLAHREAVGVSLDGVRVVRSEDPIFCLETKRSVIVFPATAWGDSTHEQELIQIIRDKFPHFSVAEQN